MPFPLIRSLARVKNGIWKIALFSYGSLLLNKIFTVSLVKGGNNPTTTEKFARNAYTLVVGRRTIWKKETYQRILQRVNVTIHFIWILRKVLFSSSVLYYRIGSGRYALHEVHNNSNRNFLSLFKVYFSRSGKKVYKFRNWSWYKHYAAVYRALLIKNNLAEKKYVSQVTLS